MLPLQVPTHTTIFHRIVEMALDFDASKRLVKKSYVRALVIVSHAVVDLGRVAPTGTNIHKTIIPLDTFR